MIDSPRRLLLSLSASRIPASSMALATASWPESRHWRPALKTCPALPVLCSQYCSAVCPEGSESHAFPRPLRNPSGSTLSRRREIKRSRAKASAMMEAIPRGIMIGPPFLIRENMVSFSTPESAPASAARSEVVRAMRKRAAMPKAFFQDWLVV